MAGAGLAARRLLAKFALRVLGWQRPPVGVVAPRRGVGGRVAGTAPQADRKRPVGQPIAARPLGTRIQRPGRAETVISFLSVGGTNERAVHPSPTGDGRAERAECVQFRMGPPSQTGQGLASSDGAITITTADTELCTSMPNHALASAVSYYRT